MEEEIRRASPESDAVHIADQMLKDPPDRLRLPPGLALADIQGVTEVFKAEYTALEPFGFVPGEVLESGAVAPLALSTLLGTSRDAYDIAIHWGDRDLTSRRLARELEDVFARKSRRGVKEPPRSLVQIPRKDAFESVRHGLVRALVDSATESGAG